MMKRVSAAFVKRDWGSGRKTWRRWNGQDNGLIAMRKLTNQESKKAWFSGDSIKAY